LLRKEQFLLSSLIQEYGWKTHRISITDVWRGSSGGTHGVHHHRKHVKISEAKASSSLSYIHSAAYEKKSIIERTIEYLKEEHRTQNMF
jgi:hypothetical protein